MVKSEDIPTCNSTDTLPPFARPDSYMPSTLRGMDITSWSPLRTKMASFIFNGHFDKSIAGIILLQIVLVVLQTDIEASTDPMPLWIDVAGVGFLAIYTAELGARLFVWRSVFMMSRLNICDAFIVFVDWLALLIDLLLGRDLPAVSFIRIVRSIRIFRAGRILSQFRELYFMMHSLLYAMKAAIWAIAILCILLTMWSIVAVQTLNPLMRELANENAFGGCDRCKDAFNTVMQANLTFFETMVVGDGWGRIAIPVIKRYPWTAVLFCGVFVSVHLGLLNLILSAIVDATMEARDHDVQHKIREKSISYKKTVAALTGLCKQMDADGDGVLTRSEVIDGFENNMTFRDLIESMDAGRDDLDVLFEVLDTHRIGHISHSEFITQLHKMKTQDAHTLLVFIRCHLNHVRHELEEQLRLLKEDVLSTLVNDHRVLTRLEKTVTGDFEDISPALTRTDESFPLRPRRKSDTDYYTQKLTSSGVRVDIDEVTMSNLHSNNVVAGLGLTCAEL